MMTANLRHNRVAGLLVLGLMFVPGACAQGVPAPADTGQVVGQQVVSSETQPEPQTRQLTNYVETGGNYLALTDGFGHWAGGYSRAVFENGRNVLEGEINGQEEFGDSGVYFGAGDTYNFNPDWYGSLNVGSSIGGFFWPRFRTDAFLNRKWLKRKQWITTFGASYYAAKDAHRDHVFYLGSTYYFEKPWIVEGGMYFNISDPGTVFAPAGFLAVTQGRNKQQYITVRAGFGEEAYQLIGPTSSLSDFTSQTLSLTWRKWMGRNWGFNVVGDYYHSPFYMRGGSSFGFFKEF